MLVNVTFRSESGLSLTDADPGLREQDPELFAASAATSQAAVDALIALGFTPVGPATRFGVTVSGSPDLVHKTFGDDVASVPEDLQSWIENVSVPQRGKFL